MHEKKHLAVERSRTITEWNGMGWYRKQVSKLLPPRARRVIWRRLQQTKKTAARQMPPRLKEPLFELWRSTSGALRRGAVNTCPCCGLHLSAFADGGLSPQRPARCPRCLTLERHRWMWLYLENHTRLLVDPLRVLHFAPEYGLARRLAALPNLGCTLVDLHAPQAITDVNTVQMDITCLALPSAAFDVILCNHVLEHVPDDRAAMLEMRRVLRPGGWALVTVPIWMDRPTHEDPTITAPQDRRRFYEQDDHVRMYGCDIVQRLCGAGFAVTIHSSLRLPSEAAERFGLWRIEHGRIREEIIFHCTAV